MTKAATRAKPKSKAKPKPNRVRDEYTVVMLTGDEKQLIQDAAALASLSTSGWIRSEMLKEARRLLAKMPKRR